MAESDQSLEQRVQSLEKQLSVLSDERMVLATLNNYARALDWLDADLLDRVIFDDAEVDYGFFRGAGVEFKPMLMDLERSYGRRWHLSGQISVTLCGEEAFAETYQLSLGSSETAATTGSPIGEFFGYYHDRLVKRDGQWGIIQRKHLLVSGVDLPETIMNGEMAALNLIGYASPEHPDSPLERGRR